MISFRFFLLGKRKTQGLIGIGIAAIGAAGVLFYYFAEKLVIQDAEKEIQHMLMQKKALHLYIQRDVHPALYLLKKEGEVKPDFYSPELLSSSYMVRVMQTYFNEVRKEAGLDPIYYKMAAINPRNPANIADDYEQTIVHKFNKNRDLKSFNQIIEKEGKKYLYYAVPFLTTNEACLKCHGDRETAPRQLQDRYQGMGGFGDELGNIRAIESIRVPLAPILTPAHTLYYALMVAASFVVVALFLSHKLRQIVRQRTNELMESENRLQRIAENAQDMIYRMALPTGNYEYVSPASISLTGYAPRDFYNSPFLLHRIVHPNWIESFEEQWNKFLNGGASIFYEFPIIHKTGEIRWIYQRNVVVANDHNDPIAVEGIVTDVSERKRLEEQLLQAQKMEAIGHLAGGVAHDFNNLLMPILGYVDAAMDAIPPDGELREDLMEIKKAGERAASLTRQLLAFSRRQILEPKIVNLNDLLANMEKMLRRLIGEDVDLMIRLSPDIGQVRADPGQIEQIVMNLAVNARDAMPTGGALTIETANSNFDETAAILHVGAKTGEYILLSVSDNGCGMDKETLSKIFDPFFTTKEQGKGTGLGLATVYGMVKQSNGAIFTYSEPGVGTTFKIYLPRIREEAPEETAEQNAQSIQRGSHTILLVEDEETVRRLVKRTLEKNGYRVLAASQGDEAIELSAAHKGPIHLLITDVILPKISGRQTAEQITAQRPKTRVLFMSGYTNDAVVQHGILEPGIEFIPKPFSSEVLLRKVHALCG